MKKILLISFCLIGLYSCKEEAKKEPAIAMHNTEFDSLLENYFEESLKLYPLNATSQGDVRYNDILPNFLSDEFITSENKFYSDYKQKLAEVNEESLTSSQQMSKDILLWECDRNLERLGFREELLPINQMWTMQLMMGQLASGASSQPFKTVADYDNWLKRLDAYTTWLASAKTRMEEGMKTGHVLPKSLVLKVTPQLKDMTERDLDKHLFFSPIKNIPESFSDVDTDRLTEAYSAMISEKIIPAYQNLYDFMNTEYMAAARTTSGIEGIPNGKEYYDYSIKLYTTTDMTADEIHQLGLSEVARISSEMEKIKKDVGFEGDLKAFFDFVRSKKELMPFTSPEQVIENFKVIHEKMKPQVDKLFGKQPKTPFEVRRTEAFREASASAEYNPGSIDGTRPGIFYTPIPDVTKYNMYSDEDLFLHEAIPGHHFQISLTQENKELPKFRKTLWYSAYGEGWALYTESLGKELGLYTDPYQYFGMLGAEMHRAIRLVVDTGLHSKGWTREEAIEYSLANEAESEAGITSEIERYMANPGQALSYKIGQLKIIELRAKAEKELGDKFDIKEFHNQVLETGCVPLALLENKINSWISNSK
ncbi:DUF885 domain-containing protein [Cellulophaga baltica]|uniref:Uncharacterized conserved protein, DUF885 familyt n=1 Tax=Cellulophaga baltica TaxID=76594 RepID=A0A1G7JCJ5_9FLAO|nr:DUF885 domain-containing protein [Cellulophaga baltica]AIY13410.1 hypothetical protein M667_09395 [Cellulophaga baltica NN016038]SDF22651.1 Uncharacterized conserved protein, DUF885 familyt [Cellulophaga baltica]